MSLFEDFIYRLREKTGWSEPKALENKGCYFTLIGKNGESMELEFFTPEGTLLIMQTKVAPLPLEDHEKEELLNDYAKRMVGACKKRSSILTIDKGNILLYRKERMLDLDKIITYVGDFLKDADWWSRKSDNNFGGSYNFSMFSNK